MTVLTRWDPFRELNTLQDRMHRLFRESLREGQDESLSTSSFSPAVDVYEDDAQRQPEDRGSGDRREGH
jgi:hypothetical protein